MSSKTSTIELRTELQKRILVLDGAMGTMIQRCNLEEDDFKGELFQNWECRLTGCNDILTLTAPHVIKNIHLQYLNAGAHIIETNTFNANAISLSDYKDGKGNNLKEYVAEINRCAAELAHEAIDEYLQEYPTEKRWVAGSVGPTNKSLSLDGIESSSMFSWDILVDAYIEQITALITGGVDVLLIETVFDGLNAKVALFAARQVMRNLGVEIPVMLSVTLTENGRTLSGQTLSAFVASVSHFDLLSIGLNCGFGADGMVKHIEKLQQYPFAISVYPNAGLPNAMGEYDETPETMADKIKPMLSSGQLNIVGGCCGTTPEHIALIANEARKNPPRCIPYESGNMKLSGLEDIEIKEFLKVGERCNVAGSRKFLRLINEKNIEEALEIARTQIRKGAQVIDINMDDAMLDAKAEMVNFLKNISSDPEIATVPVMIDSSLWDVIVAGLKNIQGRPIVNSISLKEGEAKFIERARYIKEMGAAVVVMAFDELGQADSFERKIEICQRAYNILTKIVGFDGYDIIFDPNVLAVATGIEAHNDYAKDFIKATEWIKLNLPGAKVSGGLSNLSFAFRGNNYVREAMHALFLHHAIAVGMDMAIVNPATLMSVDDIPYELRNAIEDVLFNKDANATDRLVSIAENYKISKESKLSTIKNEITAISLKQQVEQMIIKGQADGFERILPEVMAEIGSAVGIIDGPLMAGMNAVGEMFGKGEMFLPQVVKSARAMNVAVEWLTPYIEKERGATGKHSGKIVIATVKGDVHDIGKNIVNVIMRCNGYDMIDLGVMVPAEDIVQKAIDENADVVALSGLITPSLGEMCNVAQEMEKRGLKIPLLIGGATTSKVHTAVKIAPFYSGSVVYVKDAAMIPVEIQRFLNEETRNKAQKELATEYEIIRNEYYSECNKLSVDEARKYKFSYGDVVPSKPKNEGITELRISIADTVEYINWRAFFVAWKMDASFASIAEVKGCDHCKAQWLAAMTQEKGIKASEAMRLYKDAETVLSRLQKELECGLKAKVALLKAGSIDENIIYTYDGVDYVLNCNRQLKRNKDGYCLSLADYIKPLNSGCKEDWVGMFVVTAGMELQTVIERYKSEGDDYNAILYQTFADRLVEAATEILHLKVRRELWGYAKGEKDNVGNRLKQYYKGIRPAIGYPSLPDQSIVFLADKVLKYAEMDISLTENGALYPSATTTGYIISHPDSHYFVI